MSTILLLTNSSAPSVPSTPSSLPSEIIPALGLLPHQVSTGPSEAAGLLDHGPCDAVLVDARSELPRARSLCRTLRTTGLSAPLIAIVTEGGLIGVNADWGVDDVLLPDAGPAEVDARLRLAIGRRAAARAQVDPSVIRRGELVIEEETYTARLGERTLDLTFKEFELLRFMAQHPGRVFTRQQLLQDVWGYDYFGGTRTVDVHVRRLRAKLGPEHEALIGTVRNVGYRFVKAERPDTPPGDPEPEPPGNPVAGWLPAGSVRV